MRKRLRLFQAGDLPGKNNRINFGHVKRLVKALAGWEAFGYTHKPANVGKNAEAIKHCNDNGVCINLSANNLTHADELLKLNIGPVSVTLPKDSPLKGVTTPSGKKVVVCPAVITDGKITCATCGGNKGALCFRVDREYIIGFPAHGSSVNKATEIARGS
jgi:hypothetical protein